MSEPQAVIHIQGLHKRFGDKQVLKGVDLEVPAGSIFGFLGLNGAGKTTLIRTMLGLLRADAGTCIVGGLDPQADGVGVRGRVGYMAENQAMYGWMRVGEMIAWVGRFYPTWDSALAEQLREQMRLEDKAKVGTLSKGQSSRLSLLLALAHHPQLVILDDPTLGLDPIARRDFLRDVIGYLQAAGVTVFFSSHLLYEIEPICDRIAILRDGVIVEAAPVDELRERVKRLLFTPAETARPADVPGLLDLQTDADRWVATVEDLQAAHPAVSAISRNGVCVVDLNLDEIFEAYVVGRKDLEHVSR